MPIKSVKDGERVFGAPVVLHTGPGRLLGFAASHGSAGVKSVTFYDSAAMGGNVLFRVHLNPGEPVYMRFGQPPSKEEGIPFVSGLAVHPGDCDVSVWSVGYSN